MEREITLKRFGASLAGARHHAGLSQEQLADRSGLHRTYIGGLERGQRNPTVITLLALAKGLGRSPGDLLEGL
jgi:transcriptional regulator with XRE-family HTH domain